MSSEPIAVPLEWTVAALHRISRDSKGSALKQRSHRLKQGQAIRFHAWEIYKRLLRSRSINGAQREVNVELLVEGFKAEGIFEAIGIMRKKRIYSNLEEQQRDQAAFQRETEEFVLNFDKDGDGVITGPECEGMVNALVSKVQTGPDMEELIYKSIGVRITQIVVLDAHGLPTTWFYSAEKSGNLMRRSKEKTTLPHVLEEFGRHYRMWGCLEPRREFALLQGVANDGTDQERWVTWAELQDALSGAERHVWWRSVVLLGPRGIGGGGRRLRWRVEYKRRTKAGEMAVLVCWDAGVPKEEGAVRGDDVFESVEVQERSADKVVSWSLESRARQLVRAVEVEVGDVEVRKCNLTFLYEEGAGLREPLLLVGVSDLEVESSNQDDDSDGSPTSGSPSSPNNASAARRRHGSRHGSKGQSSPGRRGRRRFKAGAAAGMPHWRAGGVTGGAGSGRRCRGGYCDGSLPLYLGLDQESLQHLQLAGAGDEGVGVRVGLAVATVPRELLVLDMRLRGSDQPAYVRAGQERLFAVSKRVHERLDTAEVLRLSAEVGTEGVIAEGGLRVWLEYNEAVVSSDVCLTLASPKGEVGEIHRYSDEPGRRGGFDISQPTVGKDRFVSGLRIEQTLSDFAGERLQGRWELHHPALRPFDGFDPSGPAPALLAWGFSVQFHTSPPRGSDAHLARRAGSRGPAPGRLFSPMTALHVARVVTNPHDLHGADQAAVIKPKGHASFVLRGGGARRSSQPASSEGSAEAGGAGGRRRSTQSTRTSTSQESDGERGSASFGLAAVPVFTRKLRRASLGRAAAKEGEGEGALSPQRVDGAKVQSQDAGWLAGVEQVWSFQDHTRTFSKATQRIGMLRAKLSAITALKGIADQRRRSSVLGSGGAMQLASPPALPDAGDDADTTSLLSEQDSVLPEMLQPARSGAADLEVARARAQSRRVLAGYEEERAQRLEAQGARAAEGPLSWESGQWGCGGGVGVCGHCLAVYSKLWQLRTQRRGAGGIFLSNPRVRRAAAGTTRRGAGGRVGGEGEGERAEGGGAGSLGVEEEEEEGGGGAALLGGGSRAASEGSVRLRSRPGSGSAAAATPGSSRPDSGASGRGAQGERLWSGMSRASTIHAAGGGWLVKPPWEHQAGSSGAGAGGERGAGGEDGGGVAREGTGEGRSERRVPLWRPVGRNVSPGEDILEAAKRKKAKAGVPWQEIDGGSLRFMAKAGEEERGGANEEKGGGGEDGSVLESEWSWEDGGSAREEEEEGDEDGGWGALEGADVEDAGEEVSGESEAWVGGGETGGGERGVRKRGEEEGAGEGDSADESVWEDVEEDGTLGSEEAGDEAGGRAAEMEAAKEGGGGAGRARAKVDNRKLMQALLAGKVSSSAVFSVLSGAPDGARGCEALRDAEAERSQRTANPPTDAEQEQRECALPLGAQLAAAPAPSGGDPSAAVELRAGPLQLSHLASPDARTRPPSSSSASSSARPLRRLASASARLPAAAAAAPTLAFRAFPGQGPALQQLRPRSASAAVHSQGGRAIATAQEVREGGGARGGGGARAVGAGDAAGAAPEGILKLEGRHGLGLRERGSAAEALLDGGGGGSGRAPGAHPPELLTRVRLPSDAQPRAEGSVQGGGQGGDGVGDGGREVRQGAAAPRGRAAAGGAGEEAEAVDAARSEETPGRRPMWPGGLGLSGPASGVEQGGGGAQRKGPGSEGSANLNFKLKARQPQAAGADQEDEEPVHAGGRRFGLGKRAAVRRGERDARIGTVAVVDGSQRGSGWGPRPGAAAWK